MKILLTIPHFYQPTPQARYASQSSRSWPRLQALANSLIALRQHFNSQQVTLNINHKATFLANSSQGYHLDIIICTTGDCHLLHELKLPANFYHQEATKASPMLLGFECQRVLQENLGNYDYYGYLEDDLIIHDPWFFLKLNWFNQHLGEQCVLQPHRYETDFQSQYLKAYIDGDLKPRATEKFQNIQERKLLQGDILGNPVIFSRTLNPHSGCYFLTARQMTHWSSQAYFLDKDTSFIGPLESAATLGIMKTFRVYKTIPEYANFLEIQHYGNKFLRCIGKELKDLVAS